MRKFNFERGDKLAKLARALIPGGAHTYSKGDDQFPHNAPKIIDKGKGCYLWDVDGNQFLDFGMSLGTTILGHAYEPVLEAVRNEIEKGVNFVRPSRIEGELAEIISDIIPCAEMVKFAKHGSDATTGAVKLARAYTGRKYILRCAEDPFNSVHDWFIGSTVVTRGIPEEIQRLTLKFRYNDLPGIKQLFDEYPGQIACVLLEPVSFIPPAQGFLSDLKNICEANGALLIFDEVVSGFRFALGGVQEFIGVTPHLAAFGKAMANGFSISALVGRRDIMSLGGIDHDGERVFLLSTTHGGETHCFAAARATINEIRTKNLIQHFWKVGEQLQEGFRRIVTEHGMINHIDIVGYGCKPAVVFKGMDGSPSPELRTLFMQEMAARGILMPYIVPSFAHKEEHINSALGAAFESISVVKRALEEDNISKYLEGPAVKPVFRKFN